MKTMKITFLCLILLMAFGLPMAVLGAMAADPAVTACARYDNKLEYENCLKLYSVGAESYGTLSLRQKDPASLAAKVGLVINLVLSAFGVVFLGLVVFSGIQWMTAGGNEEKVTKARERIIRA